MNAPSWSPTLECNGTTDIDKNLVVRSESIDVTDDAYGGSTTTTTTTSACEDASAAVSSSSPSISAVTSNINGSVPHCNSTRNTTTIPAAAGSSNTGTSVYIGGIPNQYCTESVIEKIMSRYGTIVRCSVVRRNNNNNSATNNNNHNNHHRSSTNSTRPNSHNNNNFAFCEFSTIAQATVAIAGVHGRPLGGQRLSVRPAVASSSLKNNNCNNSSAAGGTALSTGTPSTAANEKRHSEKQLDYKIVAIQRKLAAAAAKSGGGGGYKPSSR